MAPLCPDCTTGGILPGEPAGTILPDGSYVKSSGVASQNEESQQEGASSTVSQRAILLLTDGFGLPLKNCKILADNLSDRLGCDVYVPDYFAGRPLLDVNQLLIPDRAGVIFGFLGWMKLILASLPKIPAFIASRPSVVDARLHSFVTRLREEKGYTHIGAVGYCYGGATAVRLGSTDLFQSVVICHPGGFPIEEVKALKMPSAWACAEDDLFFSKALRLQSEAVLAERKAKDDTIQYEFVDYKGTAHGFAARPNLDLPEVKEAHDKAFEQTVAWFQKTLLRA